LDWLEFVKSIGYPIFLLGIMMENAGIPVPGETVILAAAFLAARGHFNLLAVILVAATGASLGDNIGYWVGNRGGLALVRRYQRKLPWMPRGLIRTERYFEKFGAPTIFFGRFVPGARVFAALVAGASRMNYRRFLFYNISGALFWSISISLIGYTFGRNWKALLDFIKQFNLIVIGMLVLVVGSYLVYYRFFKLRRDRKNTGPERGDDAG